jgi:16S rRNA (uracil1498-N3)-methyltransferase
VDNIDFREKMKHPARFAISADMRISGTPRTVRVTGSELHHMRNVMRLRPGTEVMLCAANGFECTGRITGFEPDAALVMVTAPSDNVRSLEPRIILAAGVIKGPRMDLLIEKAAELNAAEFWPLICAHSVIHQPSSGRRQRWQRIALAAAKQSLRQPSMWVRDPLDVKAMVASASKDVLAITCTPAAEPLSSVIRRYASRLKATPALMLAIGPEGDFTTEEQQAMREAGFVAARLGNNRLRSETAALAALSITAGIWAEWDAAEAPLGSPREPGRS